MTKVATSQPTQCNAHWDWRGALPLGPRYETDRVAAGSDRAAAKREAWVAAGGGIRGGPAAR